LDGDIMFTYEKIKKKPKLFLRFIGLTSKEFDVVYDKIDSSYLSYELKRLSRSDRTNKIGQGNKFKYNLKTRILILLFYYKVYPTMDLASFLFDLNKSNISRNIAHLEPLIRKVLPLPNKMKSRKKIRNMEELLEKFPELIAIVDATEQEMNRPKHKKKRDNHYSGKKKKYTRKTQIIINKNGLIIDKSKSTNGKKHDKKLFDEKPPDLPEEITLLGDLGYKGIEETIKNEVQLPEKKRKNSELSKKQKRKNKKLSKRRILVENVIRNMKVFGLMGKKLRNPIKKYDLRTDIIAGLVNFRVLFKLRNIA